MLGASLARTQLRSIFGEMLRVIPDIEVGAEASTSETFDLFREAGQRVPVTAGHCDICARTCQCSREILAKSPAGAGNQRHVSR